MRKTVGILGLALTASLLLLTSLAHGQLTNTLQVSFIDVGQGDSIWLHGSDDTDILIDGGPRSAGPTVVAHLQDGGIDDIEVLVLSHGDADHVGGLIDVLQSIPVESVVYNGQHHTSSTYATLRAEMETRSLTPTPAETGQTHTWGDVEASVLNPQTVPTGDHNEDSVVMLVTYGQTDFLFTGDIGDSTEQTILDSGSGVAAEVLKVAHHGSRYTSSTAFLEAVGPELAVISVGADNPYGHPAQETLDRLAAVGARVMRTDVNDTITLTTDGQTYEVLADFFVWLPLVARNYPPTPTSTPTPTGTPTPTSSPTVPPTDTPMPTDTPVPGTTGNVVITDIFYDGVVSSQEPDEYVEIRNDDNIAIQLQNWTLRDEANHVYIFPSHLMQPGQVCRVYTNEYHPSYCGFSYDSGSAIWNNSGDCADLRDSGGGTVDTYCY